MIALLIIAQYICVHDVTSGCQGIQPAVSLYVASSTKETVKRAVEKLHTTGLIDNIETTQKLLQIVLANPLGMSDLFVILYKP